MNERDLKLIESVVVPENIPVRTVVQSSMPALPLDEGAQPVIMPDVSEPPSNGPWSPKDEPK